MKGKLALCGLVITALLLGAIPALADGPTLPHAFYGTATIGDHDAPVDSVVSAEVGGVDCGSYTIKVAGRYGNLDERDYLVVQGVSSGDTITFYVNDVAADTRTFEAGGGPTQLNLIVAEAAPSVDTNAPTSITTTSATLKGNLTKLGTALSVKVSFDWGTTAAYGTETATQTMTSTGSFSFPLSGLSDGTTYHFQAKADGHGDTSYGGDTTFTTSAEPEPEPTPKGGDGGGAAWIYPTLTGLVGAPTLRMDSQGIVQATCCLTTADGKLTLDLTRGTKLLDSRGSPLRALIATLKSSPPAPPEGKVIITAYDLRPDGATFSPGITLAIKYDPETLPEDVAEEDLVIAYYDEAAGEWVELEDCVVDTENNTITASLSHFTTFAIIGAVPPPPPPPAPAAFSVTDLSIQPAEVEPKEAVTITVWVANTGGTEGSYSVVLKINGVKEVEKSVTVAAGESQDVSFSVTKEEAGSYSVVVDGLSGSFTVVAPPPLPVPAPPEVKPPIKWPLIGGIIGGVVVVGLLVYFLVIRRFMLTR